MKILVTGANGYLGTGIVKQLLDDGVDVVATDIEIENVDERAKRIKSDIFSVENPYEFFDAPDVLLHLAWRNGFKHDAETHIDDMPKHYRFLLNMFQSDIKRIAVMGSMHEIGYFEGSIDENTPCNPMNYYGIAKNAIRNVVECLSSKYHKPFLWLRGFYIVGNTTAGSSIFSKIVAAAHKNEKNFPFTSGTNEYDFLDYNEFCLQTACAVEQNVVSGIVNICSGYPEKLSSRVERFIQDNNYDIKLQYGVFPDRPYDSKGVWGNNTRIKKILKNATNKQGG